MRPILYSLVAAGALLVGCGHKANDKAPASRDEADGPKSLTVSERASAPVSPEEEAILAAEQANLPDAVIIQVPLNEDGSEDMAAATMKTYHGEEIADGAEALAAFDAKAQAVSNTVESELDADSSTNSWHSYSPSYQTSYGSAQSNSYSKNVSLSYDVKYSTSNQTNLAQKYSGFGHLYDPTYGNYQNYGGYYGNGGKSGYGQGGYGQGGYGHGGVRGGITATGFYNNYRPFYYSKIGGSFGWHFNKAKRWLYNGCNYYVYPRW